MPSRTSAVTILVADDDPDDRQMAEEAFAECRLPGLLRFVADGEALMDYLHRRGPYEDALKHPLPGLILLDLNMPRKDGREALQEIKAHPALRHIPVVVLSTSRSDEDVRRSYHDGGSSFITKPVSFTGLVAMMQVLGEYWLGIVRLPSGSSLDVGAAPGHRLA